MVNISKLSNVFLVLICTLASANNISRYRKPLPSNVQIVDTKFGFHCVQEANRGTLVSVENSGYYSKHPDSGKVVAASSDKLSAELDQSQIGLARTFGIEGKHEEAANLLGKLQENGLDLQKREESNVPKYVVDAHWMG
ncbi:hypothetical protein N7478_009467 [Penicillium angulare]|uniref:uncharacterized protein n=1 Tax=Penicillium angulare TaxID=116970 RepID=UPI00254193BA|nr:uncharacterized protein N7478_009467 [Penicillium angulare]KAJ5266659.1 hypothetical protein N7478_009467 [Penicillium angulare]